MSLNAAPAYMNAVAIGQPPVRQIPGTDEYVSLSDHVPTFPTTDTLEAGCFKLVVPSWRRINPAESDTNDFTVLVAQYAPKTTFIKRVQLVDVDIPNSQMLIEPAWSRLYWGQGIPSDVRRLEFSTGPLPTDVAGVTLPARFDKVKQYVKLSPGVVRLFMTSRAPYPIASVVDAWTGLEHRGLGELKLVGIPGAAFARGFSLNAAEVRDAMPMAFDVLSHELYSALPADDTANTLYLYASPVPGPVHLAVILSRCLVAAVNAQACPSPPEHCADPPERWLLQLEYNEVQDRFALTAHAPFESQRVVRASIGGSLAAYMGFGVDFQFEVPALRVEQPITVYAHNPRYNNLAAYARLTPGTPCTSAAFVANVAAAMNTYTWAPFRFRVAFPGSVAGAVVISVAGGNATLADLAGQIRDALNAAAFGFPPDTYTFLVTDTAAGLVFALLDAGTLEYSGVAFTLDFVFDVTFDPERIGYAARVYPAVEVHYPSSPPPSHIASFGMLECEPPRSGVDVAAQVDGRIVFQAVPFAPVPAEVTAAVTPAGFVTTYIVSTAPKLHGLQVGATAAVTTTGFDQQRGYVTEVLDGYTFGFVREGETTASFVADTAVTLLPQDVPPLNLVFQRAYTDTHTPRNDRHCAVDPDMFGFPPIVFTAVREPLISPGTLDIRQDPYVLLCLAFQAGPGAALTGDVFYPFACSSQLVFARVPRASLVYRPDFDRVFDHLFPGSGQHLGYIRVKLLNGCGTPYQTHGHAVSITLKFDVRQSGIAIGGGGHTVVTTTGKHATPGHTGFMAALPQVTGGNKGCTTRR